MRSTTMGKKAAKPAPSAAPRQHWADVIRVVAVLIIFLFHFGYDWADSRGVERGAWWQFVQQHFAEWGIAAFVVLSGFALTLSLSSRKSVATREPSSGSYLGYLARRLGRIFGPYWLIAIPFALAGFALGEESWSALWKLPVWLLGLGVVHPDVYQPISEAWWYVSLALQISLLMPLLVYLRRRWRLLPLTIVLVGLNAALLALVELVRPEWAHLAQGFVLCRLTEIAIGMAAAGLVLATRKQEDRRGTWATLACVLIAMAAAYPLDLLGSWTAWQAMLVLAGVFTLGGLLGSRLEPTSLKLRGLTWAATISYCFYLTHAPISKYIGRALVRVGVDATWVALPLALIVCALVAWVADWVATRWVVPWLTESLRRLFVWESRGERRKIQS